MLKYEKRRLVQEIHTTLAEQEPGLERCQGVRAQIHGYFNKFLSRRKKVKRRH